MQAACKPPPFQIKAGSMTDHIAKMKQMLVKARRAPNEDGFVVAALYKFADLPDYKELQPVIQQLCDDAEALGTILLAKEGINGTICAPERGMSSILEWLAHEPRFETPSLKFSFTTEPAFLRMKVRLKSEIVTMGVPQINPAQQTGTYVDADEWNKLLADPDVMVVDTRNTYEKPQTTSTLTPHPDSSPRLYWPLLPPSRCQILDSSHDC